MFSLRAEGGGHGLWLALYGRKHFYGSGSGLQNQLIDVAIYVCR